MEISRDHPATPLLGVHPCGLQSPVRWPAAPVPLPLTVTAAWRSSGAATNPPLYALSSIYNGHTVAIQSEKVPCFRRRAAREIDVCVNQSCRSLRGSERPEDRPSGGDCPLLQVRPFGGAAGPFCPPAGLGEVVLGA
ncbi:unnamed protein product [Rangifer tarandus platyrhynchus]|uniref:Uncharacterized protein n=1 Tax=Rangifer tarandus platyrhynchus TaxID=3082113 RepID=A0ABN8ZMF8_RANTA|nr:unnamed protein product [Rangifer tarandus platyrhynchus]